VRGRTGWLVGRKRLHIGARAPNYCSYLYTHGHTRPEDVITRVLPILVNLSRLTPPYAKPLMSRSSAAGCLALPAPPPPVCLPFTSLLAAVAGSRLSPLPLPPPPPLPPVGAISCDLRFGLVDLAAREFSERERERYVHVE